MGAAIMAEALCRGCAARHHERCSGWTDTYETTPDNVLRLIPCACPKCTDR